MIYGYARVSTHAQAKDGNSLEAQIKELEAKGAGIIYKDEYTGTKSDRPEFQKLLCEIKSGDSLVVTKLDRFARSAREGMQIIDNLINKGVTVNVINMGVLDNTTTGKLIRNILLCFAEFERDMIVERTSEGKAIAKAKPDFKEGRPEKYSKKHIAHALDLLRNNSFSSVAETTGISRATLVRYKAKYGNDLDV